MSRQPDSVIAPIYDRLAYGEDLSAAGQPRPLSPAAGSRALCLSYVYPGDTPSTARRRTWRELAVPARKGGRYTPG